MTQRKKFGNDPVFPTGFRAERELNMNCRDAKVAIALHLGHDDGDPQVWDTARRHAATCPDCRQHYKKLKKSMALLEQVDPVETYEVQTSLWPEVEARLSTSSVRQSPVKKRSWTPLVSVAVASLLFLMVWVNPPQEPNPGRAGRPQGRGIGTPFINVMPSVHPDRKENEETHNELPPSSPRS